jgi:hypothetical protein
MKTFLLLLNFLSLPLQAQVTYFNDSQGMPLGTANRVGNTTYYNNANGFPLGTANTPQPTPSPISLVGAMLALMFFL